MRLEEVGAGKKGAREEDVGVSLSRASSFFLPQMLSATQASQRVETYGILD